jgi:hypothetical protein
MQWNFRNWRWIRYARAGKWAYLDYRNPREEEFVGGPTDEVIPTPEGPAINGPPFSPATWSQVGVRFIRFNHSWNGPGDLELQGMVYKYSDWQQTKADFRHYLLDVASDLLLYQTMLRIASSIKDTRLRDMYLPLREDALKTVMNADQDAEYGEARDDHMEYTGIYR